MASDIMSAEEYWRWEVETYAQMKKTWRKCPEFLAMIERWHNRAMKKLEVCSKNHQSSLQKNKNEIA